MYISYTVFKLMQKLCMFAVIFLLKIIYFIQQNNGILVLKLTSMSTFCSVIIIMMMIPRTIIMVWCTSGLFLHWQEQYTEAIYWKHLKLPVLGTRIEQRFGVFPVCRPKTRSQKTKVRRKKPFPMTRFHPTKILHHHGWLEVKYPLTFSLKEVM